MLFNLVDLCQNWLDEHGLSALVQLMYQLEFRALLATALSFAITVFAGPKVIRWLHRKKVGDSPEFYNQTLNELMKSKANTPTMGGILIVAAIFLSTVLLSDWIHSRYAQVCMIVLFWLAGLGFFDDRLKLTARFRKLGTREGLFMWEKLLFTLGIGIIAGYFLYTGAQHVDATVLNLPFQRTYPPTPIAEVIVQPPNVAPNVIVLPFIWFVVLTAFWIGLMSNAVNLTDGMDGLATGTVLIASIVTAVLVAIAVSPRASFFLMVPHVPEAKELLVIVGTMAGACIGFLWFNCQPAAVFMGDTGSLALGGLLATILVAIRQELLLPLVGGVFLMEAGSVVMQVGWFKITNKFTGQGRRIFRCAPIHHHFQLQGWSESQTVIRFWLIALLLGIASLVMLKLR
ncbi:MAG: phospho-N-acetylmuramoyl-pentapeptide-transferase [Phycisphaerales bacterium]|nr:phospho-N-acetylmuramoyl-pentapeptide-transferase [Phycisphaerales bacterium]